MFSLKENELKTILLETADYQDNEYLDKYIQLMIDNYTQEYIKYHTQKHHFIPVSHYGLSSGMSNRKVSEKLADNDPKNFKINLLYKNHVLAHYYLSKCAISYRAISINCKALQHILGNMYYQRLNYYIEEKNLLLKLDGLQEAYTNGAKAYQKSLTEEQKLEISKQHSKIQKEVAKNYTEEQKAEMNAKRQNTWDEHSTEQKQEYSERKSREVSEIWKNRTPEQREAIRQKIIATKKVKSEEQKQLDIQKQVASFKNHSEEELLARKLKKQQSYADMSDEAKLLRSQRISEALQKESSQRSERSKKMWENRTAEEKALISKKIWDTRRKNLEKSQECI